MTEPPKDRRVFLGRESPLLTNASSWLFDRFGLDLASLTLVVPGARAARLLLGELVAQAELRTEQRPDTLVPPTIITPSNIPQALGASPASSAGGLACRLAWTQALRDADPETLSPLIPIPPAGDQGWSRYAALLQRASDELAWHQLNFQQIRERSNRDADLGDESRWRSLESLQQAYLAHLHQFGFVDRLLEAQQPQPGGPVVLIGVLSLPPMARALASTRNLHALVYAPPEESERYCQLGLVQPNAWAQAPIEVNPERVIFADGPREQADAALGLIAKHASNLYIDDVTLGICDPDLAPFIERIADRAGHIAIRSPAGETVERTGPFRLLTLVRDVLRDSSFKSLTALTRHPDALSAMRSLAGDHPAATRDWLDTLDAYATRYLPTSLREAWRETNPRTRETLELIQSCLESLLGDLSEDIATPSHIANSLIALLDRVYGDMQLTPEDPIHGRLIAALDIFVSTLRELDSLGDTIRLAPAEAIDLILAETRGRSIAPNPEPNAIEALGWLELLPDSARTLVLVGFNEGAVPTSPAVDPILTDRLRIALNMDAERDRLARDCAILHALLDARESVHIVVGRHSASNDPIAPSRLLFRSSQTLAMTSRWISPEPAPRAGLQPRKLPGQVSTFAPHPVRDFDQPATIRISSFRQYLKSPYLFYLQHLLGLKTRADDAREMDPSAFGTLMHDALAAFGQSSERDLLSAEKIDTFLQDSLSTLVRTRFGDRLSPTLGIQQRFARDTLTRFALWQAERAQAGWRITHAEWPAQQDLENEGVEFQTTGAAVLLKGRIDRIDLNQVTGQIAILDYKTASKSKDPHSEHRDRHGIWLDLQLPLYRHLASRLLADQLPELGYIVLDAKSRDVDLRPLVLNAGEFRSADDAARNIIDKIRANEIQAIEKFDQGRIDEVFAWIAGIAVADRTDANPAVHT